MNREDRQIRVTEIETTTPQTKLAVTVKFIPGGINYSTYKNDPRAYIVDVAAFKNLEGGAEQWVYGHSLAAVIEPTERFNAKRLKTLADTWTSLEELPRLVQYVLQRTKLELASDADKKKYLVAAVEPATV
jgi:hypothetical protein